MLSFNGMYCKRLFIPVFDLFYVVFEIKSHHVTQADITIAIFLLQAPMCCWDDRYLPSYPGIKDFTLTCCTSKDALIINQLSKNDRCLALILIESSENALIEALTRLDWPLLYVLGDLIDY